jgi:2-methylcitrate dehydratase PrpD
MRMVRLETDSEIEQKGWDRAARVTIGLANKQRHSTLVIHFKGTPRNPLSHSEVEDKARKLTHRLLSEQQLERLVEAVDHLEKIDDVSHLGDLLRKQR